MSSAKAALESDTRVLAYEAGRKFKVRVNTISAGPLGSRAAKAIGFIDDMIRYVNSRFPACKDAIEHLPPHLETVLKYLNTSIHVQHHMSTQAEGAGFKCWKLTESWSHLAWP